MFWLRINVISRKKMGNIEEIVHKKKKGNFKVESSYNNSAHVVKDNSDE